MGKVNFDFSCDNVDISSNYNRELSLSVTGASAVDVIDAIGLSNLIDNHLDIDDVLDAVGETAAKQWLEQRGFTVTEDA